MYFFFLHLFAWSHSFPRSSCTPPSSLLPPDNQCSRTPEHIQVISLVLPQMNCSTCLNLLPTNHFLPALESCFFSPPQMSTGTLTGRQRVFVRCSSSSSEPPLPTKLHRSHCMEWTTSLHYHQYPFASTTAALRAKYTVAASSSVINTRAALAFSSLKNHTYQRYFCGNSFCTFVLYKQWGQLYSQMYIKLKETTFYRLGSRQGRTH